MFRSKRPRDILNEIKWRFDLSRCRVYYIHRGAPGDIKIVEGRAIKNIDRSFLILEGAVQDVNIPYHRIVRIDYDDTPVYLRKSPKNPGIQDTAMQNKNQNI
ncbi:MAG: RNA repair domain-containing protein [Candidatus Methanoperedens sp.]|nr:RNA repair domain-containing protein [Candidatus Methanoperedens sp.]MCZ7395181.1 RNA repair domain-containing protein [Candidatus Methanoperedens sp.]